MLIGSLDWNISAVRSAKLAKGWGRVKPKPVMSMRNPSGRIRKRADSDDAPGELRTHQPQRFQPPGAGPHAGW